TLPVRDGYLWGVALAAGLACLANLGGQRALPWLGLLLLAVGFAFYGGLALDPRPPRIYLRGEVELRLAGNFPAAALLSLCYAALNACVAGDVIARFSGGCTHAARLGALCGGLLGIVLLCGNAALERGGEMLLAQALPMVLLAARWGLAGFWLCAGFGFLCSVGTLAAALGGLRGWMWVRKRC
ncbi:MAG: hypothetical protein IJ769_01485, partial [Clostridia bacterium]|nr:hypothetical protein [Clostridia bacterium]